MTQATPAGSGGRIRRPPAVALRHALSIVGMTLPTVLGIKIASSRVHYTRTRHVVRFSCMQAGVRIPVLLYDVRTVYRMGLNVTPLTFVKKNQNPALTQQDGKAPGGSAIFQLPRLANGKPFPDGLIRPQQPAFYLENGEGWINNARPTLANLCTSLAPNAV